MNVTERASKSQIRTKFGQGLPGSLSQCRLLGHDMNPSRSRTQPHPISSKNQDIANRFHGLRSERNDLRNAVNWSGEYVTLSAP